jgi:hypothetical protein
MMQRVPVSSTTLASIGYDEQAATLEVEFMDGHVYQYFGVPLEVHTELMAAGSLGGYFNRNVKDAGYQYARVG